MEEANLQGALFYSTLIVDINNPSKATVFNVAPLTGGSKTMFDEALMGSNDWKALDAIAKEIPNDKARIAYQARIKRAKVYPSFDSKKVLLPDNSPTRVQAVVTELCQIGGKDQLSRLAAAQGFRNNFNILPYDFREFRNSDEYQKLLLTLDTTLCTLEACQDLRDGIEGLDCKTITK